MVEQGGQAGGREERMTCGHLFLALSSYRLDGRSIREGNPVDRMPGPYADEHTRQGGGAIAGPREHVPARVLCQT